MGTIFSHIISGFIGLLLAVWFYEPLCSMKLRFEAWFKRKCYRPRQVPIPRTFALGSLKTSWLVIDGNGELVYTPEALVCLVEHTPVEPPLEVIQLRNAIEKREAEKEMKGLQYQWNGPLYALEGYAVGRTVPDEHLKLTLTFRPTDYFTFQATVLSIDTNLVNPPAFLTLRQKYIEGHDPSKPIVFLANGFGVVLVIITKDRKLILSRRHDTVGARPGEHDVSVVEAVHPIHDRASDHPGPDLFRTAIRGAQEELGIVLLQSNITFLGFGVDMEYYQWNIVGVAHTVRTAGQVLEGRTCGTAGKWETRTIKPIDADPRIVFNYLRNHKMWSTGWIAIYWALVHEWGKTEVDAAAREIISRKIME